MIAKTLFNRAYNEETKINVGEFFQSLLVADKFVLNSVRLEEPIALIKLFGPEKTRDIIDHANIRIYSHFAELSDGQHPPSDPNLTGPKLPLGTHSFAVMELVPEHQFVTKGMEEIDKLGLSLTMNRQIRHKIANKVVKHSFDLGQRFQEEIHTLLKSNDPGFKNAVSVVFQRNKGILIHPSDFEFNFHVTEKSVVRIESNISKFISLDPQEEHDLFRESFFALCRRERNLIDMEGFDACISINEDEKGVYDKKLQFLLEPRLADSKIDHLKQILEFKNLPDFSAVNPAAFNVDKFLNILQSNEIKSFRDFLWGMKEFDEKSIAEISMTLKDRVAGWFNSGFGKTLRIVSNTGIGLIPKAGTILSTAVSFGESFLLDKYFSQRKTAYFINKMLPTIFKFEI